MQGHQYAWTAPRLERPPVYLLQHIDGIWEGTPRRLCTDPVASSQLRLGNPETSNLVSTQFGHLRDQRTLVLSHLRHKGNNEGRRDYGGN